MWGLDHSRAGKHRRDIQGLRGVAVIAILGFHAGLPAPGRFVRVDSFFVISGFVVTATLQLEHGTTGHIGFAHFYLRRCKRLTPALALMISVVLVASALILSPLGPQQGAARTGIAPMLPMDNFLVAFTTAAASTLQPS